ncbi:hypothetical protein LZ30DRAFT_244610 [Colletotrichum cereale]|nr:hypothetical protein LZ30DRAFT_244610 [Colletotrichum cereale]
MRLNTPQETAGEGKPIAEQPPPSLPIRTRSLIPLPPSILQSDAFVLPRNERRRHWCSLAWASSRNPSTRALRVLRSPLVLATPDSSRLHASPSPLSTWQPVSAPDRKHHDSVQPLSIYIPPPASPLLPLNWPRRRQSSLPPRSHLVRT